jgi:hypothetical protein
MGFAILNIVYVSIFIAAAWLYRANPGVLLIVAFIVVRTTFLTQLQTCEPRYVVVCFPAVLAVAAQLWRRPQTAPGSTK